MVACRDWHPDQPIGALASFRRRYYQCGFFMVARGGSSERRFLPGGMPHPRVRPATNPESAPNPIVVKV